ncbi:hypothetical protein JTB14_005620 [Gonioctena quinquepunctata]|nr:hypothetical protein JTB14_005620 [Gonioctena quinquepunctata]
MAATMIELKPNRLLLDSNFDGYKLSLEEIPSNKREFSNQVDRVLLNTSQYSLLHAKLFGFHNFLTGDGFDENDSVYFFDTEWNLCKTYIDPICDELIDPIVIWRLPRNRERKAGDYNVSLKFLSASTAVIGDGTGVLYIVDTGSRNDDDPFSVCFSDEVAGQDEAFVIVDAVTKVNAKEIEEIHSLLVSVEQNSETEKFSTILHWITFSKVDDAWRQEAIRQVKTRGFIQYAHLERDCGSIYMICDSECKVISNSDFPIETEKTQIESKEKVYSWSQNIEDITVRITLPADAKKELINVATESLKIEVKYDDGRLMGGDLYQKIETDMTTWTLEQNVLEVVLNKSETGSMWPELIKDDQSGEHVVDTCIAEQVHERLSHLCSDNEALPQSGTTFNSQQVEECDFEGDKSVTFVRLSGTTNKVTHRINLGSHQVLVTSQLSRELPAALGIRHDVDICLWQPQGSGDDFSITHEGTLLAIGYVQASKQNKKFTACPPNLSYTAICETSGHLFIYKQNKSVSSGEVRNRSTGRRICNVAQQQVVNISSEEVLGIFPSNKSLFLLYEKNIVVLKVE